MECNIIQIARYLESGENIIDLNPVEKIEQKYNRNATERYWRLDNEHLVSYVKSISWLTSSI